VIRSRLAAAAPRCLPVLAAAALIAVLAGCEAGNNAPTTQWHPPTAGQDAVARDITISNVFVLGPALGQTLPAGGSASVFLALYNSGSYDKLLSMSAPGTARSVTLPGGAVSLPSEQPVLLTGPAPEVILNGLTHALQGGTTVKLILNFKNTASVTMIVPVMPRSADYSTYSPPPSPTPSPTATPKAKPSPGASPTPTPSASPSPAATP
jgi:copper(I)-binding protein